MNTATLPSPSITEDVAASLAAIRSMSEWLTKDRDQLGRIFGNRAIIDRSIEVHSTTSHADWSEVYLNTAHATAKLLLKARDIVVIRDGDMRLPFWLDDYRSWEGGAFTEERDHCAFQDEFRPGAEDTEALCDALVAAGAREIES
jgi:hypothetical protein